MSAKWTPRVGILTLPPMKRQGARRVGPTWSFLTNHCLVLACISQDPEVRLRDVAARVGITERAAQSIVADLVATGYLDRTRVGRRNHYSVHLERRLLHPLERVATLRRLLAAVAPEDQANGSAKGSAGTLVASSSSASAGTNAP